MHRKIDDSRCDFSDILAQILRPDIYSRPHCYDCYRQSVRLSAPKLAQGCCVVTASLSASLPGTFWRRAGSSNNVWCRPFWLESKGGDPDSAKDSCSQKAAGAVSECSRAAPELDPAVAVSRVSQHELGTHTLPAFMLTTTNLRCRFSDSANCRRVRAACLHGIWRICWRRSALLNRRPFCVER